MQKFGSKARMEGCIWKINRGWVVGGSGMKIYLHFIYILL